LIGTVGVGLEVADHLRHVLVMVHGHAVDFLIHDPQGGAGVGGGRAAQCRHLFSLSRIITGP